MSQQNKTGSRQPGMGSRLGEGQAEIAVVILTMDEEVNIAQAVESAVGWAAEVVVVDSGSRDDTVDIARSLGARVVTHEWSGYAAQRNFALHEAGIESEWVLFLDADEWLMPELKTAVASALLQNPGVDGFMLRRRLIWMGRWIRRGYYPVWLLRLVRRSAARCEDRQVNEHLLVDGETSRVARGDIVHEDRKGIGDWITKHARYARLEAQELLRRRDGSGTDDQTAANLWGTQAERTRWLRFHVWERMPPVLRPFPFFMYRYFLRGGFLDGRAGFAFHLLQGLWYPLLIDLHFLEAKRAAKRTIPD